jgi:hypothetical protein
VNVVGIVLAVLVLIVLMRLWSGRMYRAEQARKQAVVDLVNTEIDKAIERDNLQ